jgi:hypothetical protein
MTYRFGRVGDRLIAIAALLTAVAAALVIGSPLASAALGDPPEVTGVAVSEIRATSARLEATVDPNGADTGVQFLCRRASDPPQSFENCGGNGIGSGTKPVLVTARPGLQPDTEYVMQVRADSPNGLTVSTDMTFQTLPALAPTVTTPSVSEVTNDAARFTGAVNPRGTGAMYHFEYRRAVEVDWISVPDGGMEIGNGLDPLTVSERVEGLDPDSDYVVRLVATNFFVGSDTSSSESFTTAEPGPPRLPIPNATDVTQTGTRFVGKIDPNGEAGAEWHFEYRRSVDGGWISIPQPDESLVGSEPVVDTEEVHGLQPATEYRVRVVGSGVGGSATSPERSFVTRASTLLPPAERGDEQVTPSDKNDVDLLPQSPTRVSESGEGIAFLTENAIGDDASATLSNQYVARRTETGWISTSIDPPPPGFGLNFLMFDRDLSKGLLEVLDPPELVPGEAGDGNKDFFVRDNRDASYDLVTTEPPNPNVRLNSIDPEFSWAASDLGQVVFSTRQTPVAYFFPNGPEFAAYHWAGGQMTVASIPPGSNEPFPDAGAGAGLNAATGSTARSVSEDGSRIIFTAPHTDNALAPKVGAQLYVRKDHGTPGAETIHISAAKPGVHDLTSMEKAAFFRTASVDGSKVFFTSCQRLTVDSTASGEAGCPTTDNKNDLYLYDLDADSGTGDLVDLTTADPHGAAVKGVLGAGEDGSRVYFVANGDLGGTAEADAPNLYLWRAGGGIEHIATLDVDDTDVWAPSALNESEARISANGRQLAFSSVAKLTSFENAGHRQVYLYSEDRPGQLECASCPSDGGASTDATLSTRPTDPGRDPQNASFTEANLTDDGRRVFFETAEALEPQDSNGRIDVYEYDFAGDEASLVSSGQSASASRFVGASSDGEDVFFFTRERLVGWDVDALNDIYDAKVDGGFDQPAGEEPSCDLDCQRAPSGRPMLVDPRSTGFAGPGNMNGRRLRVSAIRRSQKRRFARTGRLTLRIAAPRAGRIVVRSNRCRTVAIRIAGPSTKRLTVSLHARARRILHKRGRLRVRIVVEFDGDRRIRVMVLRSVK